MLNTGVMVSGSVGVVVVGKDRLLVVEGSMSSVDNRAYK